MTTCFTNVQVFQTDGFVAGSLYIEEGKIIAPKVADQTIDGHGLFLAPGLIDLQVNGIRDIDFTESLHELKRASALLAESGVTSFLATTISQPLTRYPELIQSFQAAGSTCLGLHLEGPHLNPARHGAHCKEYLVPHCDLSFWKKHLDANIVKMVTVAPELSHAKEFLELLLERGIIAFCGHTDATVEELRSAKGLQGVTHLFNAMRPLHQREPGPIGYVLGEKALCYSLIVDGQHLHPDTVAMCYNAYPEGLLLVSDLRGSTLGGKEAVGPLVASKTPLLEAVMNLQSYTSCGLHQAIMAASTRPAELLGLQKSKGKLLEGYDADFILFDQKGSLKATYVAGKELFS